MFWRQASSPVQTHRVVVTGASRGLGLGIARRLSLIGYEVIAIARRDSEGLAALRATPGGGAVRFVAADLSDIGALPGLVGALRREFGAPYGLVNNAGIGTAGVLANMRDAEIEELVRLNTVSPLILTKYIVRAMLAAGTGRIVNVASIVGFTGYSGLSAYSATKAGLIGFTRSLAREVGRAGITVNAVAPGFIDTELTQGMSPEERERIAHRSALQRLAGIDDVAAAVEFLLGEGARNMTGTVLTVDAGNTA
jgi:3-oxoacyl-[acyl-carrier protein] reductase